MTPTRPVPSRLVLALLALLGTVLAFGAAPAAAERKAQSAADTTADRVAARAARDVRSCARPALSPSVKVQRTGKGAPRGTKAERRAQEIALAARRQGVPARAQALAVAAALGGDLEPGKPTRKFFHQLGKVKGWETLPPTIAAHRVVGSADPFRYEDDWGDALDLIDSLSAHPRDMVAVLVSAGARAPSRCYASAADVSALPLPPGSSFAIRSPKPGKPSTPSSEASPSAEPSSTTRAERAGVSDPPLDQETLFEASCGTPVVAATAGKVTVSQDNRTAGPWLISVRSAEGVITWYSHVQRPRVATGDTVLVGQPLAEVGDLGDVRTCALGLSILARAKGSKERVLDPVEYLTRRGAAVAEEPAPIPATSFRIASYNVLGYHLTAPGGGRPGWGNGASRVAAGIGRLESAGVSIVILNEFESPQAGVFVGDGEWAIHRATPNNVFRDGNSSGNAVGWRKDTWKLVATDELTVPWQVTLHMPIVTLEHLETGARVRVMAVHNPASTAKKGNQQGARVTARVIELAAIADLLRSEPNIPVLFGGDLNERATAFCGMTSTGLLASSAGGSVGGACQVPRHGPVDWIFGSLALDFQGQFIDKGTLGRISDHPLVIGDVVFPEHEAPAVPEQLGDPNVTSNRG